MRSVAYWTPLDEPEKSNTLIYILRHPSREAATANWKSFQDDPEWKSVRDKSAARPDFREAFQSLSARYSSVLTRNEPRLNLVSKTHPRTFFRKISTSHFSAKPMNYDAILVVSFGGPESPDDVIPFLEAVLRGRNVPRERLLTVAEHYYHFGGKSPINQQTRELIAALESAGVLGKPQLASAAAGDFAANEE